MIESEKWIITDAGLDCGVAALVELATTSTADLEATGGNLPVILINGTVAAPRSLSENRSRNEK